MSANPISTPACIDLALAWDTIPHIAWCASADGAIDHLNRRGADYLGIDPDAVLGQAWAWLSLLHPDDVGEARRGWQEALASGTEIELDFRIRRADGVFRWFQARGVPALGDGGAPAWWFGTWTDIGKRRAAGEQPATAPDSAAEAFRTAGMDHMAEGLFTTDSEGRVTSVNRAAARMLGWSERELVGQPVHDLLHTAPDGRGHAAEDCPVLLAGTTDQQVEAGEEFYLRKDGTTLAMAYSASSVHVGPTVAGAVVVFRDITELKQRQWQELEGRHDQKLEALGRLSAGLAHEINTPIQFVGDNTRFLAEAYQTMLELLLVYRECLGPGSGQQLPWEERKRRADDAEEKADIEYLAEEVPGAVEQSLEGIDRVASLVRAMKAFSYKDTKEHSYADLNEGIRTTVIVARNEVKYVADVVLDLGEVPDVLCHLGDLNQVFLNLLVNAADAMPTEGERGEIKISTRVEGSMVVIKFADNGTGIPEEIRKSIFDPFFTTKEVGKGTGQGLALAAGVCEKHGGTIVVNSELGVGTEFVLTLPISGKRGGTA